MLGFFIGTACLVGLVAMIRRGRRYGGHYHRGRGFGRRGVMNRLFSRLETSASQEKLILGAVEEVELAVRGLRPEVESTRADIARVMTDEHFDSERLGALFARHNEAMAQVQAAVASALGKVHGALDSHQRTQLAQLVEQRMFRRFGGFGGGPYRQPVHI